MRLPIAYQDPFDRGPLVEEAACLHNPRTGAVYPVRDETPVFLPSGAVDGPNAKYQRLYDRIAIAYDLGMRLYAWRHSSEAARRKVCLDMLEIPPGGSVLEVSVGTGANWVHLDRGCDFYGLDLSAGMLARCRRQARRLGLRFQLCQGMAERLPYPDNAFDCVLHVGGINFFTDQAASLSEMSRVAKPGTRLVVVDETEEAAKRNENRPIASAFFRNRPRTIAPPAELLPAGMADVEVKEIWGRELYVLTWRKPRARKEASGS